ncbi:MAG: protoporphyrinogen oxidase [bacterium]|nr:protoporphyrinogen oxidase [bacterium]
MHDVIVAGGGIAGLTAAINLEKQGLDVLLLEENEKAGGNIKTIRENGINMEAGPHSFMGSSEYTWKLVDLLEAHDAVEAAAPSSKNRYIYRHDKLSPLPMSLVSFLGTGLLSLSAKLRLMMEPFIPNGAKEKDTAWEFFCRRFGKEAATYIMTPFISGVYAGDVKMLGARAAFTKFWKFEKNSGSMIWGAAKYMKAKRKRLRKAGISPRRGLFSFKNGLGTITETLAHQLKGHMETGVTVENIRKNGKGFVVEGGGRSWAASAVVTAAPPRRTALFLEKELPQLKELFDEIPMAPVTLIHWRVKDDANIYPDGFGFLMPRLYDLRVLGTLFPSRLFNDRIADGYRLLATFYGGMTDPDAMDLDDEQLKQLLFKEHKEIFGTDLEGAEILKILRYPEAIPQLLPDHPEKIEALQKLLTTEMPGIFPAGNYLTGVGIEHAVESGFRAAGQCAQFIASGGQGEAPLGTPMAPTRGAVS